MKFWQNPEIKQITIIGLAINLFLGIIGLFFFATSLPIILAVSLFWFILLLLFQYQKYKKIHRLNATLDQILFEQKFFPLDNYKEGELSILAINIEKILLRLKENQDNLLKDKNYLANHLADISHQLRTPLASLNLMIDRLKDDIDLQEKRQLLQKMMLLSDRINRLIESLLLMSKLDAGVISFDMKSHALADIINQAVNNVVINLEIKNIRVETQISGHVICDAFWLTEAISNLIKNSVEHSHENALIEIRAQSNTFFSEIFITDYGSGISKQDLPHIFERFYRGENAAKNSIGIGLALSKQLIQLQRGEIFVKSIAEQDLSVDTDFSQTGTTFQIKFYHRVV